MRNLVYGDENRLFVNTALGCEGKCKYCYLSSIGINEDIKYYKSEYVIEMVENYGSVIWGQNGTIISIGCYSECLDEKNKIETYKLIKYFINKGNYIQIATKKYIEKDFFAKLDSQLKYKNQLSIFISIPTISCHKVLEEATDNISKRIENLSLNKSLKNIELILYIKPVINGVTVKDINDYIYLINTLNVKVVVGEYLSINGKKNEVGVGENLLFGNESFEINNIISILKEYGQVFNHSTDIINNYREESLRI